MASPLRSRLVLSLLVSLILLGGTLAAHAQTCTAPTISYMGGGSPICQGQSITLYVPGTWASYQWSNGATTYMMTDTPSVTTSYTVTVTDGNGCQVTSEPFVVEVLPTLPGPAITTSSPAACPTGDMTASTTVQPEWTTMFWTISGGTFPPYGYTEMSGVNNVTFRSNGTGPIILQAWAVDTNGCSTAITTTQLDPPPTPVISAPANVCRYGSGTASVAPAPTGSWQSVMWTITGGHFGYGTTGPMLSISGDTALFYPDGSASSVVLTAHAMHSSGCETNATSVEVPLRTIPEPVISAPVNVCRYGSGTASVAPPAEGTWQMVWWQITGGNFGWDPNNWGPRTTISGETVTFYPDGTGPIVLTAHAMDSFNCEAPTAMAEVPLRTIPEPVISVPVNVCRYGSGTASVAPPAEGTWQMVWWEVTGGNFGWDPYSWGPRTTISGETVTFYPDGTGPILLTAHAMDSFNCEAPVAMAEVPLRTIPEPVISVPANICRYSQGTASVAPPAEGTWQMVWWEITGGNFGWDPYTGGPRTTISGETVSFFPDGTGPILLTAHAMDSFNCEAPVAMAEVPLRTIPEPVINAPANICRYGQGTASVAPPAEGTWQSVWWSITGGNFGYDPYYGVRTTINGETVTFYSDGTGPILLTAHAMDSFSCEAPLATVEVPLRTIPAPVLNAPASVCAFSITNSISIQPPAEGTWQSVSWTITGGVFGYAPGSTSAFGESVGFSPTGTGPVTITVSAMDSFGCAATRTVEIPVRVVPPPTISAPPAFCSLDPVGITAAPPAQGTWQSVSWSVTGGVFDNGSTYATGTMVTVTPDGSGPVTLSLYATDSFGCSTQPSTVTIPYDNTAAPTLSAPSNACTTGSFDVTAGGSGFTGYAWNVVNGTTATGNFTNTASITPDGNGPVTVNVTAFTASGCSRGSSVTVPLTTPPSAAITSASTVCAGGAIMASVPDAGPDAHYAWSIDGGQIKVGWFSYQREVVVEPFPGYVAMTLNVTVYRDNGCQATSSKVIAVNPAPTAAVEPHPARVCENDTITLTATETNPGATYNWTIVGAPVVSGQGTRTITIQTQYDSYRVDYTLNVAIGSCTKSSSGSIDVSNLDRRVDASGPTTFCQGGSVTLTAKPGYTYAWSSGATTQAITVTQSGSYTVTITDPYACSQTSDPVVVNVDSVSKPNITVSGSEPYCNGETVTLVAPQSAGYTYLWSNGATGFSTQGTVPGTYTVTVTNATGCSNTSDPVTLSVGETPTATVSGTAAVCAGGSATIQAALTGTAPWSVTWSDGVTQSGITASPVTRVVSPSATTTYTITSMSSAHCSGTASGSATVTVNDAVKPTITAEGALRFCQGGSVTLTSSPAASYLWSNGATTQSIVVASGGSYTVTITDANGCSKTSDASVVIVDPLPDTTVTPSGPTTFCEGGGVWLDAAIGSYTYQWSNGSTERRIHVSDSGTFTVTLTNSYGCTATSAPITVTENVPVKPTITASASSICPGGSATLTSSEAAGYLWSTGETTRSITVSPAGSTPYWVDATDANGCTRRSDVFTVSVSGVSKPTVTVYGGSEPYCNGQTVTLVAPQSAGYSYLWSNGGTGYSTQATVPGTYTVTVTNTTGCSNTSDPVTLSVGEAPTATVSGGAAVCAGGSATIQAALTGTAPWSVTWSDGVTQSGIAASPVTRVVSPSATTTYTITSFSSARCTGTVSGSATVTINNAAKPTITADGALRFCQGGSVTLTSSPAASYLWSNGATTQSIVVASGGSYTVAITDANGCSKTSDATVVIVDPLPDTTITPSGSTTFCEGSGVWLDAAIGSYTYQWSNGSTERRLYVTDSGTFTVTLTNSFGCTATSAPITVTKNVPVKPTITPSTGRICPGGTVTLTSSEAASYAWSTGETTRSITVSPAGSTGYWVNATDANGCTLRSDTYTVIVDGVSKPNITAWSSGPYCDGQTVWITSTQSTGYSYLWSTGETTFGIQAHVPGTYTVTVTNETGCSNTSDPITLEVGEAPTATVSGTTAVCAGGSATIQAALTGTAPWSVTWSDGVTQSGITASPVTRVVSPSATTTYTITSMSSARCSGTVSGSATVTVNANPTVDIIAGPIYDDPGSGEIVSNVGDVVEACGDPTVRLRPTVLNPANSYSWSTGATTAILDVRTSGTYTLTMTDANGCTATSSITVNYTAYPAKPNISAPSTELCPTGGSITLTAPAATSWLWSNGATTQSIVVTAPGSYSVRVKNNLCESPESDPVVITTRSMSISASGATTFCQGESVTLTASPASSYLWSNGATSQAITVYDSGNYSVTGTFAGGCTIETAAVSVTVRSISASIAADRTTVCPLGPVQLSSTVTGGSGYSYQWYDSPTTPIPGATSAQLTWTPTASGTVFLRVTDAMGCATQSNAVSVTVVPTPNATITASAAVCEGSTGHSASVADAGPGATYSWSITNGTITPNGRTATFSPSGLSPMQISITVTNPGCLASSSKTVTVNALPAATITPNGPTALCPGGTVRLTASAGSSYQWSNGSTAAFIDVPYASANTFTVTVTNAAGCSRQSAPVTVTQNAATVITSHPQSQSMPRTATRTLSVGVTGTSPFLYEWFEGPVGDTSKPKGTNATLDIGPYPKKGTYSYWVRVRSSVCPSSVANSNAAIITVNN